jgi:EAL domain-containing protein (putative c-di-GMP-specific phosphodiesterase class I)/GGDEF domain-containing protein
MVGEFTDGIASARDALTGLFGPEQAQARLDQWMARAQGLGEVAPVHAMLLSLRRFDTVNLAFGERAGDSALVEVGARILRFAADEFEREWFAARLGGGHFMVALHEACSRDRWEWLGEALADSISHPISNIGELGNVRLSPRVSLVRVMPGETAEGVMDRLARTLARLDSKLGRRVLWSDGEIARSGRTAAQIEADLLGAIDRDEIEIVFQPQFTAAGSRLTGAEALARWQHPQLGRVGAGALFGIAERTDHVAQLSHHIAKRALAAAAAWPEGLRLSLNVTPADLALGSFAEDIARAVLDAGFPPERLTLEIVEQSLVGDLDRSARLLGRLVDLGIKVALDDFGAGFCNFRYLKLLPIHYLKLDRSMADGIESDPRDLAVFRAIIALAKALDLEVLAEGIERADQLALIAAEGCDYYQGFLGAKPMSGEDFLAFAAQAA